MSTHTREASLAAAESTELSPVGAKRLAYLDNLRAGMVAGVIGGARDRRVRGVELDLRQRRRG